MVGVCEKVECQCEATSQSDVDEITHDCPSKELGSESWAWQVMNAMVRDDTIEPGGQAPNHRCPLHPAVWYHVHPPSLSCRGHTFTPKTYSVERKRPELRPKQISMVRDPYHCDRIGEGYVMVWVS